MGDRDLVIQLRLPRLGARSWGRAALALAFVGGAIAWGNVAWTPFNPGEKLSAAKMNADFTAMANAIEALQNAPPAAPQPHLVVVNGNVDLGVFLGSNPISAGNMGRTSWWVAEHPSLKAPYAVQYAPYLAFDAPNCTGNVYAFDPGSFANLAFNTPLGTIYQVNGPAVNNVFYQSVMVQANQCSNQQAGGVWMAPLKNTQLPNIAVGNQPISIQSI